MIPSDHFVRYYNEVFKALHERGLPHLQEYWRALGELQSKELAERFRVGGLAACHEYWSQILHEENCEGALSLTDDYFEFRMDRCPSLSKVLDNDAAPSPLYCDHCVGWVQPVMEAARLYAVQEMCSREEPRCLLRVYRDPKLAAEFERTCTLVSRPYA